MEAELISEYIVAKPWMILVILISLSLVAIVRYSHHRIQSLYFKAIISNSLPGYFLNEEKVISHRASIILLLNTGVFLALLTQAFSYKFYPQLMDSENFGSFIMVFLFLALFFVIKALLQTAFRIIFEQDYGLKEYILNLSFINMFLGIVLIPIALATLFMSKEFHSSLFNITIAIVIFVQVLKLLKGSLIALKYKVNLLYFILYLCAFEIIPIMVLVKEVF